MSTTLKFMLTVLLCQPLLVVSQEEKFETCYLSLCEDGELTLMQIGNADKIEVKSKKDGHSYGIISFTVAYSISGQNMECTCRENKLTARCIALRDKLSVDDHMIIKEVVFKDIRGGGKIRTAPDLNIRVVKPYKEE
ncbi:MAG: hypothetical protein R2813_09940 [Flavobacteriales bacterium]